MTMYLSFVVHDRAISAADRTAVLFFNKFIDNNFMTTELFPDNIRQSICTNISVFRDKYTIFAKYYFYIMNFRRLMIISAACAVVCAAGSCKKDKDDDVNYNSFSGTLNFKVPLYVLKGEVYELTPLWSKPDAVDKGYYWTASPLYTARDTTRRVGDPDTEKGTWSFKIKDTLCTVTVSCTAFASGYYTKSASNLCTIVDPAIGGSLTEDGITEQTSNITDSRDSKVYYYKKIGNLDWFIRNLAYADSGVSYEDCAAMDDIFGRYYSWDEARTACPDGWRLPSENDWADLASAAGYSGEVSDAGYLGIAGELMADAYFNNTKMWEYWPEVKITNGTGFTAIPTGYVADKTAGGSEYAVYWSSESYADDDRATAWMINVNKPDLLKIGQDKSSFHASVRCVRDSK